MTPRTPPPLLGLVGDPVAQSVSPAMQQAALDALGLPWRYCAERIPDGEFLAQLAQLKRRYRGLNVTRPHKLLAAQACDSLTPQAQRTGSVNTLTFDHDAILGDSTDGDGMLAAFAQTDGWLASNSASPPTNGDAFRAVVLGTGGAARAATAAFLDAGIGVVVVGRNAVAGRSVIAALTPTAHERGVHLSLLVMPPAGGSRSQGAAIAQGRVQENAGDHLPPRAALDLLQAALAGATALVNATPVGGNDTPGDPLPADVALGAETTVLDMIYTPRRTPLLRRAAAAGCATVEGVEMLVHQGARSLAIWTGLEPPIAVMAAAARAALDAPNRPSPASGATLLPKDDHLFGSTKSEEAVCCDS